MSTLQCGNIIFESTANNRWQYAGSNTFVLVAGGANVMVINTTAVSYANLVLTYNSAINASSLSVGTSFVANTSRLVVGSAVGLQANGSIGSNGQVLTSNATTVYWANATAGATGGGPDKIFWENDTIITTDYTVTTNKNAMTAGPVTLNTGITVTVPSGSTWTVV